MTTVAFDDRLDFALPEFTRFAWVNDLARSTWQDRFTRIQGAWRRIERDSVSSGLRACHLTRLAPEHFALVARDCIRQGLVAVPLGLEGASTQPYAATPEQFVPGQAFTYPTVIGKPDAVRAFEAAWQTSDHRAIGELLGYPACCREFFAEYWVDQRLVDTTWSMARRSASAHYTDSERLCEITHESRATPLLRWLGVRLVSHLPCAFDCEASEAIAAENVAVGDALGFRDEMKWATEALGWNVEWAALHGIAHVSTPVVKIVTRTDATAHRYCVRVHGPSPLPPEAPSGLRFPFKNRKLHTLTGSSSFRRGLASAGKGARELPDVHSSYTDNGFSSFHAMRVAHQVLIRAVHEALPQRSGTILDLGAGNGRLLEQLCLDSELRYWGVEIDARKARTTDKGRVVVGDLFDPTSWQVEGPLSAAILMLGRLVEAERQQAEALLQHLRERTKLLVLYTYDSGLAAAFSENMQRFGLEGSAVSSPGQPATVAIVRW